MKNVYLDYSATSPVDRRVAEAMMPYFTETFGNASSIHGFGRNAKNAVERARERIAQLLRCLPEEIFFTGGGTEADNWALAGYAEANADHGKHIVTTVIEHHAVLHTCSALERRGFEVTYLPVDEFGTVDPAAVEQAIRDDTILVSVMHANNEVGTIQDIGRIGGIVRNRGAAFFTDAVQTFGKVPIDVNAMNIDLLAMSGHKICGPKGVGALYVREGTSIASLLHGGEHERGRRAGTENVPAIAGFGAAVKICRKEMPKEQKAVGELRDYFHDLILKKIPDVRVNGHPENRLANNLNVSFLNADGESVLLSLDLRGVAASSGSACTAGGIEPSHVIKALHLPPEYGDSAIRFSIGRFTTRQDIDYAVDALTDIVGRIRSL